MHQVDSKPQHHADAGSGDDEHQPLKMNVIVQGN
jgi:hypothetical protein